MITQKINRKKAIIMITNATEFIHDLHKVLRGAAKRADEDITKTINTVSYKLKQSGSLHYELSRWRCSDARHPNHAVSEELCATCRTLGWRTQAPGRSP